MYLVLRTSLSCLASSLDSRLNLSISWKAILQLISRQRWSQHRYRPAPTVADIRACCGSLVFQAPPSNFSIKDAQSAWFCWRDEVSFQVFFDAFASIKTDAAHSSDVSMPYFACMGLLCLLAKIDTTLCSIAEVSVHSIALSLVHLVLSTLLFVSP